MLNMITDNGWQLSTETSTAGHSTSTPTISQQDTKKNSTPQNQLFCHRSIDETEVAKDLLLLSQNLPPLPNHDQNYDPIVNEVSSSYVIYNNQQYTSNSIGIHYKIDEVNENVSRSNHPQSSYSNDNNQSRDNLMRHEQTHRNLDLQSTNKPTHTCSVCGKLFSRAFILRRHLQSHSGIKPYGCAYCGKAFADQNYAVAHVQFHFTNKKVSEVVCIEIKLK